MHSRIYGEVIRTVPYFFENLIKLHSYTHAPLRAYAGLSKPLSKTVPDYLEELTGDPTPFITKDDNQDEDSNAGLGRRVD